MKTKKMIIVSLCTALMFVFSQLSVPLPFTAVPITMQVFGVILISTLIDYNLSFTTMVIYILLGSIGIPVFSNFTGGFFVLTGPTGGYIIGFLAMSIIIGLANKTNNKAIIFISAYLALIADYILGVGQLKLVTGASLGTALASGLYPFILKDVIITAVAVILAQKIKSMVPKTLLCVSYHK